MGWASIKNGKLLTLIEEAGFDAPSATTSASSLTKTVRADPSPRSCFLKNNGHMLKPNVANVATALAAARSGKVTRVDVGSFVRKQRKGTEALSTVDFNIACRVPQLSPLRPGQSKPNTLSITLQNELC